jgi:hypothetical protein
MKIKIIGLFMKLELKVLVNTYLMSKVSSLKEKEYIMYSIKLYTRH